MIALPLLLMLVVAMIFACQRCNPQTTKQTWLKQLKCQKWCAKISSPLISLLPAQNRNANNDNPSFCAVKTKLFGLFFNELNGIQCGINKKSCIHHAHGICCYVEYLPNLLFLPNRTNSKALKFAM